MASRKLRLIVFAPIAAYLVVVFGVAAFVVHPPLIGWIGLLVMVLLAVGIGSVAVAVFPHMRTNIERTHPHAGAVYRLLVIADTDSDASELSEAVALRVLGRRAEVRVVAPVIANPIHFLADREELERADAHRRLRDVLVSLAAGGIHAQGVVGADDPLQAVGDALAGFRADEILLVSTLPRRRAWLEDDFERRARDQFGIPVATLFTRWESPEVSGGAQIPEPSRKGT